MLYTHKNNISFKKLEIEDLSLLKELKDESWFGTHQITIVNMANQVDWFNKISRSSNNLILVAYNKEEVPVGIYKISNIDWINRSYDSAHDIFSSQRRKGFGKRVLEAGVDFGFEVLNINRLNTEVIENNKASIKIALNAGFIEEGRKQDAVYKCNEYLNSTIFGLLKKNWLKLKRVKEMGGCCNTSYKPINK